MRLLLVLLSLLVALPAISETQRVDGLKFDRVLVMGNVSVEISQGEAVELLLRGDQEELNLEPFYLSGKTLVLGVSKKKPDHTFSDVKFKLTVVELEQLKLAGSGEVFVKPLQTHELYATVEGSGDIKFFELAGHEITLQVSGSGAVQVVDLQAEELEIVLAGSGDVDVGKLNAKALAVILKGSGDITVKEASVTHSLDANVVGSGDIDFSPVSSTDVEVNIVGSGAVRVGPIGTRLDALMIGSGDVYYSGNPDVESANLGSGGLHRRDDH